MYINVRARIAPKIIWGIKVFLYNSFRRLILIKQLITTKTTLNLYFFVNCFSNGLPWRQNKIKT